MPSRWQVNLRLSRDDYEYIRRKADEQGQTVTALLRNSAFATTMRAPDDLHAPDVVIIDATTWCGILRELNHWGVNYNQAVHAFNTCALALGEARESGWLGTGEVAQIAGEMAGAREQLLEIEGHLDSVARSAELASRRAHVRVRRLPAGSPRERGGE